MRYRPALRSSASVAALAVALATFGCASGDDATNTPAAAGSGPPNCGGKTVQVASRPGSFIFYPFMVAIEAGYMKDAGLTVKEVDLSAAADAVSALVSGSVSLTVASVTTIISAVQQGAPITMVGTLMDEQGLQIIVKKSVLDEHGITADSSVEQKLSVFAGDKLNYAASSPGSGSDTVARVILEAAGVDAKNAKNFIYAGSSQAVTAAFESGKADATGLPAPQSYAAIDQGGGELLFNLAAGDFPPLRGVLYTGIATSNRIIQQDPGLIHCFLYAVARAEKLIKDDYAKAGQLAQDYMVQYVPGKSVDLYNRALADYKGAFPDSPVVTDEGMTGLIDVLNKYGSPVTVSADKIFSNTFAQQAVTTLTAAS